MVRYLLFSPRLRVHSIFRRRFCWAYAVMVVLVLFGGHDGWGQVSGKGTIEGTVTDLTGAVISGAKVTARETETGTETTRTTTGSGYYVLSPLDPGNYTVSVSAKGFESFAQEHVTVNALQVVGLPVKLSVGSTQQTVTVTDAPPELETENAELGGTMEQSTYQALPVILTNGKRDPTAFASLMPGVQTTAGTSGLFDGSGSRGGDDEIYVDGIALTKTKAQGDTTNVTGAMSVDAIDQFQVVTSSYPVEYNGQGFENYVVKSGTNNIHGSTFEYFRNTALDTWGYFQKIVVDPVTGKPEKPAEHQNEYGVTLGGPIIKNKVFLFASYDGDRYSHGGSPTYYTVPTEAARSGDFTEYPNNIFDPTTTSCVGAICTRQQFMGMKNGVLTPNVIPADRFSPVALAMQKALPAPTNDNLTNNYIGSEPVNTAAWDTTDKLDYVISPRQTISVVAGIGRTYDLTPEFNSSFQAPLPYGQATTNAPTAKTIIAEHTLTLSPHLVNQLKFGFARYVALTFNSSSTLAYAASSYGISGLSAGDAAGSFPKVSFTGTDGATPWAGERASRQTTNTYTLVDNLQWVKGKHSLTFGIQAQWLQDNEYNNTLNGSTPAAFAFNQPETEQYAANGALDTATGLPYASFLAGAVDSATLTQLAVKETGARFRPISPYAEDDWKVTQRLTVNLGLRWDYSPPFEEVLNRFSFMNLTATNPLTGNAGALEFAGNGVDSCHCASPLKRFYGNFGPRLGAAYQLNDKTVLRAGFGMMYSHGGGTGGTNGSDQGTGTLGFSATPTPSSQSGGVPAFYIDQGFPAFNEAPFYNAGLNAGYSTAIQSAVGGLNYGDPYLGGRSPEFVNFNVGFERSLTKAIAISVNYVGSQSHFLRTSGARGFQSDYLNPEYFALGSLLNANATSANIAAADAIIPGVKLPYPTFSGTIGQMLRPFPQYSSVSDTYGNVGNANYNALQLSLKQQQPKYGLTFMLNYTYAKMIDDEGDFRSGWLPNRIERSTGTADQPQNLSVTAVYGLPFGKGGIGDGNGIVRAIASGWKISGIYRYYGGTPIEVTGATCSDLPYQGTCFPSFNASFTGPARIHGGYGHGITAATASSVHYINDAAFMNSPAYTFGNVPRTRPLNLWNPGGQDLDASLRRSFTLTERVKFAAQVDMFNVANNVVFGGLGTQFGNSSFGTVSSQSNSSRDIQLAGRFTF